MEKWLLNEQYVRKVFIRNSVRTIKILKKVYFKLLVNGRSCVGLSTLSVGCHTTMTGCLNWPLFDFLIKSMI